MTTSPALRFDHARDLVAEYLAGRHAAAGPAPEPLRHLLDMLLGGIRELDRERAERERRLERTQLESETDRLTGLLNAQGWERRLDAERDRHRRFGEPAAVVSIRHPPDTDFLPAARTLRSILGPAVILAHPELATFTALLLGADAIHVAVRVRHLRHDLAGAAVTWSPLSYP
jgi:hypothetical protein